MIRTASYILFRLVRRIFQRHLFTAVMRSGTMICLIFSLTSCREEEFATPSDTSGWPEIHLGFHSFRAPPDFETPETTASLGTMSIRVSEEPGTPSDIVQAQNNVGTIVRHFTVNDWDIFVTKEDSGLVVSSYTFLVFGLQRIGHKVVMTRDSISRTQFPDADDRTKWDFHRQTILRSENTQVSEPSFLFEGVEFQTTYLKDMPADIILTFTASARQSEADLESGTTSANFNSYDISFDFERYSQKEDPRPLAAPPDISTFPGVKVRKQSVRIVDGDAGFSRVEASIDGEDALWFDAAIFWFGRTRPVPGEMHASAYLKFSNEMRPADEAEARALGILMSVRKSR